jgi:uncharacterized protein YndB with AHSA1/START domain
MPTATASRRIAMATADVWRLLCDPYHLPRWWPRVEGVELVESDSFTQLLRTKKGKAVRADFDVVKADEQQHMLVWEQRLEGTPFANVLAAASTEVRVQPLAQHSSQLSASEVTIELRQELARRPLLLVRERPLLPRMDAWIVRRAATRTIREALDGLERIGG